MRRRWGRRSETYLFGSRQGERERFGPLADGTPYDLIFVFDDMGYNFEPSEIGAAYGLVQLDKLERLQRSRAAQLAAPRRLLRRSTRSWSCRPRTTEAPTPRGCATRSCSRDGDRPHRGAASSSTSGASPTPHGVDAATSCASPASRTSSTASPPTAFPDADRVMDRALSLPTHHGLTSDDMGYVIGVLRDTLV